MRNTPGEKRSVALVCLVAVSVALWIASCASVPTRDTDPAMHAGIPRPTWRVGDRWLHAWTSGPRKGVKTSEFIGVREVGGVRYNVLRVETAHLYYTSDLHWAANIVDARVVARATPPQPWFDWPLQVGKRWEYRGAYEAQDVKDPLRDSYHVVALESVTVPAGTFRAVKIVREVDSTIVDEYWYAPAVGWYVKWVGQRGKEAFQEVLQEYIAGSQASKPIS